MDEVGCFDPDLVCTSLLHDTGEDTEDIDGAVTEMFFGKTVAYRVRLLTKVPGDHDGNLERALLTEAGATTVKCCDRTDNLRSLPPDQVFRDKQLAETYEYLTALQLQPFPDTPFLRKAKVILRGAFIKAGGDATSIDFF
jgi:(p)ppGpp synthase/HD superfamily hydrolase